MMTPSVTVKFIELEKLGGKVKKGMNRSEASDYIKELMGRESGTAG